MQRSSGVLRALVRARGLKVTNLCHNGRSASQRAFHICQLTTRNEQFLQQPCSRLLIKEISPIRLFSSADYPGHFMVTLPALSPTMDVGTIVRWEKQVGDKLVEGDLLCEIETDKATMGFETPEEGYLARVFVLEGTRDVPINKALCIITENEGDVAAFRDFPDPGMVTDDGSPAPPPAEESPPTEAPAPPPPPPPPPRPPLVSPAPTSTPESMVQPATGAATGERIFASPLAKKLAAERGIDLQTVTGSGPRGRIRKQDIESFVPSAAVPVVQSGGGPVATTGPYIDLPVDQYRQELAQRAVYSKQTVPHYFLTVDIEADKLLLLAEDLNQEVEGDEACLQLHHFVIKAAALACHKVPAANSSWMGEAIRQFVHVDVNFTMQSDGGQIGPVVSGADTKGLATISEELSLLNKKLSDGMLQPEDYQGGTFTVTDLSSFGVKTCGSVITPPQACSLAMGALRETFVPDDESEEGYRAANVFSATLACDHRVVDGAVGAQWLQHFKGFLQKPHTMLL
ncbi:dihydrolipoyllysine-residue acetyltransferase component of pyruvate dehydrogenase complex, mitochondrial-like isoform X2 [Apostichopus japonicus]|uniref:dihydrolipoyllysine-residue acetyltransferase component of pyruvate dehydrogenase complex, mitochondrial-like isoform X2 n=1 Tax=Stichopus japonicus TaxID=307972 RepID=UPI003AB76D96